jgi:hypothetical protein
LVCVSRDKACHPSGKVPNFQGHPLGRLHYGQSRRDDKGDKHADGTQKHCRNEGGKGGIIRERQSRPLTPGKAYCRTPSNAETDPAWLVGALFMTSAMPLPTKSIRLAFARPTYGPERSRFLSPKRSARTKFASTCLPLLMHSVEIDGEVYWDGGFAGSPVIFPLVYECETRDIVMVHLTPAERPEIPSASHAIMNRMQEIGFNSALIREMRAVAFVN